MRWCWPDPEWPNFRLQPAKLAVSEAAFLKESGVIVGTVRHVPDDERMPAIIELISTEALRTSEIEGDLLDRDSVQSSLRRQFGLQAGGGFALHRLSRASRSWRRSCIGTMPSR